MGVYFRLYCENQVVFTVCVFTNFIHNSVLLEFGLPCNGKCCFRKKLFSNNEIVMLTKISLFFSHNYAR